MEQTVKNNPNRKATSHGGFRPGMGGRNNNRPRRGDRGAGRAEVKPEFDQKVINIRRVARVVAGGRRFNFSVAMVIGDKNGRVGVGVGKAGDTQLAMSKAFNQAKKNMIKVKLTDNKSIAHEVLAKFKSSQVILKPAKGRGLVAGSSLRTVLSLAGIHDVNAKIVSRSKDKLNIARTAIGALASL